jgi:hypothetical protein
MVQFLYMIKPMVTFYFEERFDISPDCMALKAANWGFHAELEYRKWSSGGFSNNGSNITTRESCNLLYV